MRYYPHFHLGMRVMTLIWCFRGWQVLHNISRDNRFRLTEGLYLKIKITTAEKRTKLLIIDR
jgi:hypothetical protein